MHIIQALEDPLLACIDGELHLIRHPWDQSNCLEYRGTVVLLIQNHDTYRHNIGNKNEVARKILMLFVATAVNINLGISDKNKEIIYP